MRRRDFIGIFGSAAAGPLAARAQQPDADGGVPIAHVRGVTSLAWPGGNLTGINFFSSELAAKRMELLREMVRAVARVAVLGDPTLHLTSSR
jgi:hypothetical protein